MGVALWHDLRFHRRRWLLLPLVVAAVAHGAALDNAFVADDEPGIVQHPVVNGQAPLRQLLDYNHLGQPAGSGQPLLRPLSTLSFALEWRVWGARPLAFHLVNVTLFLLIVFLVHRLLARLLGPGHAVAGATLFAAMAIHVDAVAPAVNRSELLALLFTLLMLEGAARRRWLLCVAAYAAALLSKESAILGPLVLAAFGLIDRRWLQPRALIGTAVVAALFLWWRVQLRPFDLEATMVAADNALVVADLPTRCWMVMALLGRYLALSVLPVELSFDYSYAAIQPALKVADPHAWIGVGFVCLSLAAGLGLWRGDRGVARGEGERPPPAGRVFLGAALAFACSYALVSNSLTLITIIFAERLFLAPSLWLLVMALVITRWIQRRVPAVGGWWVVLAAGLVLVQAPLAALRTRQWRTPLSLFAAQVSTQPDSVKGRLYLARALAASGADRAALWHFGLALVGRRAWPAPWRAPRLEGLDLSQRLLRLPRLLDADDPRRACRFIERAASAQLGPRVGLVARELTAATAGP